MIKKGQGCIQRSHQQKKVEYVCLHQACKVSRLLCQQCIEDNIHKHEECNNKYILDQQQFMQTINQDSTFLAYQMKLMDKQQNQLQTVLSEANQLVEVTQLLKHQIQNRLRSYNGVLNNITKIKSIKFHEIDNLTLNKLININQSTFNNGQFQQLYTQTDELLKTIQIIKSSQEYLEKLQIEQQESQIICQFDQPVDKDIKTCDLKNHNQSIIDFVCIYPYCNLNRFLCSYCIKEDNHRHMQPNFNHLISFDKLLVAVIENIQKVKTIYHVHWIKQKELLVELEGLMKECRKQNDFIQQKFLIFDQQISMLKSFKFNRIDQDRILKLYYGGQYYLSYNLALNIEQLSLHSYNIKLIIDSWSMQSQLQQDKLFSENSYLQSYQRQVYIKRNNFALFDNKIGVNITKNYKYYSLETKLQGQFIFDFINNNLVQRIRIDNLIQCSKFSNDGKFLYIGDDKGFIYKSDLHDNQFRLLLKKKIHQNGITSIILIKDETIILTASQDKFIIKTKNNLQVKLMSIDAHSDEILDQDYNETNNIIVSCSRDKSIRLWDDEVLLIYCNHNSGVKQVLFLQSYEQLISSDYNKQINIWLIQYQNKIMQKLHSINYQDRQSNIYLILDKSYFVFETGQYQVVYSTDGVLSAKIQRKMNQEQQSIDWVSNLTKMKFYGNE